MAPPSVEYECSALTGNSSASEAPFSVMESVKSLSFSTGVWMRLLRLSERPEAAEAMDQAVPLMQSA